jgi:hypothetical protein
MHISAWLRGLGLERYEAAFRDNEIDWSLLPKLTADDLKDIGVAAVGHCRAAGERDELILPVAMTSAARAAGGGQGCSLTRSVLPSPTASLED